MKYNPELHHRRSIRLRGYDYSRLGAYHVTLVTYQRECLFGEILNNEVRLNEIGQIAGAAWVTLPDHFRNVELDEFIVMPNHLHAVVVIVHEPARRGEALADAPVNGVTSANADASPLQPTPRRTTPRGTRPRSLNAVVQNFKSITTRRIHNIAACAERPIWQRDYYEHIIRNDADLQHIRTYIRNNAANWNEDDENPTRALVEYRA